MKQIATFEASADQRTFTALSFSPDHQYLAVGCASGDLVLFSSQDYPIEPVLTFPRQHALGINDVKWSVDARYIATASDDTTVILWSLLKKRPMRTFRHTNYVFCLALNVSGTLLASGAYDETVKIWDIRKGKCVRTLPAHGEPVTSVGFSRDGTVLVTGSMDGLIRLWETASGQCLKTLDLFPTPLAHVQFTPNQQFILASHMDGCIRLYEFRGRAHCQRTLSGSHQQTKYACPLAVFQGEVNGEISDFVITAGECGKLVKYPINKNGEMKSVQAHQAPVIGLALNSSTKQLATCALDGTLQIWSI